MPTMALVRRGALAPALPGPVAGRGRTERRAAGRGRRRARDDRARVPRRPAGPAAATARGADRPRRARLAGERGGVPPRDERRGGQQRAPASARDDAGAPAGAACGLVRRSAERGGARAAGAFHRRARTVRCSGCRRDRVRGASGSRCRPTCSCSTVSLAITPLLERAFGEDRDGDWRLVPTQANRMPTAASYLRRPGDSEFRAFKFDVLRIEDGADRGDHDVRRRAVPGVRPTADALTSVHVGAAVAPRRDQPACDRDRSEYDERSARRSGFV